MSQFNRFYQVGRDHYDLPAIDAFTYARDRTLLWDHDSPLWDVSVDNDGDGPALIVSLIEESDSDWVVLDSMGGIAVEFSVSDHGNILTDFGDPYLTGVIADMMRAMAVTA